jgi:hypothetical protein
MLSGIETAKHTSYVLLKFKAKIRQYIAPKRYVYLTHILIVNLHITTSTWSSKVKSRDSSVCIATGLRPGRSGFEFRSGLGIFLFTTASRTALVPTQPPMQLVPEVLSLGIKRPGRESDHSPPSSSEVKNAWSYTYILPIRLHGVVLS